MEKGEILLDKIRVKGKNCIGCKKFDKDIMISYLHEGQFTDLFLNQELAEKILIELKNEILNKH